jgi:hypothetical protein
MVCAGLMHLIPRKVKRELPEFNPRVPLSRATTYFTTVKQPPSSTGLNNSTTVLFVLKFGNE